MRLIVAHDPQAAAEAGIKRDRVIQTLERQAAQWAGKLDEQDGGKSARGRKLSDGGARARFYHEVCEAHLARIVRVDLKSELFTYTIDERALAHARLMDGKLLLVTSTADLAPEDVVKRYKSLADIERGFRVLKSEIEIGPIHHRLCPSASVPMPRFGFIALILYRVMRSRLRAGNTGSHPNARCQNCAASSTTALRSTRPSPLQDSPRSAEQADILAALTIKKPNLNTQIDPFVVERFGCATIWINDLRV